ncbi:stage II sporulation protein M [Ketobacter sp.]|uniref:stage II sporulation protein M n=1 Tax=Ketobacter sp. TaxID=2083498 RepID=UPI000F291D9E|nr:stage II sporulation protein M [Ketobacter sp.]RLU01523.1 MAG: stage II sporulation protein M [Ketobacter sp.]
MKQELFEQNNRGHWQQFESKLDSLESRKRSGKAPQVSGFAEQYRQVCHHLALAQERQYSPHLIDRLNQLALRGHQQLYKSHTNILYNMVYFILVGFPAAVRREIAFVGIASTLFFGSLLLTAVLTYYNPSLVYSIYPEESVMDFTEMYNPASKARMEETRTAADDFTMFSFYIKNNIGIGFQTFASGFLLGAGAIFNLLFNGIAIGAVTGYLTELGYTETFFPFVVGHGAFELTGIAIAGAAGLKLGYGLLCPGRLSRKQSLIRSAREAMPLVYGVFFMLLVAAFVEAFWSSSSYLSITAKYTAGASFWLLVLSYFALGARRGSE